MAIRRASVTLWFAPLRSRQTHVDSLDVELSNIRIGGETLRSRRLIPVAIQVNQHMDLTRGPRGALSGIGGGDRTQQGFGKHVIPT